MPEAKAGHATQYGNSSFRAAVFFSCGWTQGQETGFGWRDMIRVVVVGVSGVEFVTDHSVDGSKS